MHVIGLSDEDCQSGNNKLYNVLMAYANYDSEVEYTQGLNLIVALFLFFVKEEEQVFWCLFSLMNKLNLRQIFTENLEKVISIAKGFTERLSAQSPHMLV